MTNKGTNIAVANALQMAALLATNEERGLVLLAFLEFAHYGRITEETQALIDNTPELETVDYCLNILLDELKEQAAKSERGRQNVSKRKDRSPQAQADEPQQTTPTSRPAATQDEDAARWAKRDVKLESLGYPADHPARKNNPYFGKDPEAVAAALAAKAAAGA